MSKIYQCLPNLYRYTFETTFHSILFHIFHLNFFNSLSFSIPFYKEFLSFSHILEFFFFLKIHLGKSFTSIYIRFMFIYWASIMLLLCSLLRYTKKISQFSKFYMYFYGILILLVCVQLLNVFVHEGLI